MPEKVEVGKDFLVGVTIPEGSKLLVMKEPSGMDDPEETRLYLNNFDANNCICVFRWIPSNPTKARILYSAKPSVNIYMPREDTFELLPVGEKAFVSNGQQLMIEEKDGETNIYVQ